MEALLKEILVETKKTNERLDGLDQKIDSVRCEILKETALLEAKIEDRFNQLEMKIDSETSIMKVDIDSLSEKAGKQDIQIKRLQ